ncbi:MAG: HD domain-containing phosphohydrolase [Nitrospira sp.]
MGDQNRRHALPDRLRDTAGSRAEKVYRGETLTSEESQLFNQHPFIAFDLVAKIPRMTRVAEIIKYQDKYFDGVGMSGDHRKGNEIPMEARILKVALDFDDSNPPAKRRRRRLIS